VRVHRGRRPDDLDAVDPPAVEARVVVEQADDAPRRGDAIDGVDQLERLAREPARTDEQQRPQGATVCALGALCAAAAGGATVIPGSGSTGARARGPTGPAGGRS
jgi:hypothetical protein